MFKNSNQINLYTEKETHRIGVTIVEVNIIKNIPQISDKKEGLMNRDTDNHTSNIITLIKETINTIIMKIRVLTNRIIKISIITVLTTNIKKKVEIHNIVAEEAIDFNIIKVTINIPNKYGSKRKVALQVIVIYNKTKITVKRIKTKNEIYYLFNIIYEWL